MSKNYLVRLKPYNKRRGFLVMNYMTGGVRFTSRWTKVSARKARELEQLVQPHAPEDEIPLFDVKTEEEAKQIEEEERDKGLPTARVKDADAVPDSKFRDDRPRLNDEGEVENPPEPAEVIKAESAPAAPKDPPEAPKEVEPAPSLRRAAAAVRD